MTKRKLIALGLMLLGTVITAAVQSGILPNVCPPPPTCGAAPSAAPKPSPLDDLLDAGSE